MESKINNFFENHKLPQLPFKNENNIKLVHDVMFKNSKMKDDGDAEYYCFIGRYYLACNNFTSALNCYNKAVNLGEIDMLLNVIHCYKSLGNIDEMVKVANKAIANGYYLAANAISSYYYSIKDYTNMLKYCHLAIDNGIFVAASNLAQYYIQCNDPVNAEKYALLAGNNGFERPLFAVSKYYERNNNLNKAKRFDDEYKKAVHRKMFPDGNGVLLQVTN